MSTFATTQHAYSTPFDNENGNGFVAVDTQRAIEEARERAIDRIRVPDNASYNGNAGSGKWLERYASIGSDVGPLVIPEPRFLVSIALTATSNSTGTIQIIKNPRGTPSVVATISLSNQKVNRVDVSVSLTTLDELGYYVSSGSITRPGLTVEFQQVYDPNA